VFSVIIPTRNRPALLCRALASVRRQRDADFEVILVDDGTAPEFDAQMAEIEAGLGAAGRVLHLPRRPQGHGPSFALNRGAEDARGDYLCFLDDDDEWTDDGHLARVAAIVAGAADAPDVLYFQQEAVDTNGAVVTRPIWIEDVRPALVKCPAGPHGTMIVDADALMQSGNFCHVNTTVISRAFYQSIGGMDEGLRYENDRDFYFRCADRARVLIYGPQVVARHYIPNTQRGDNISTMLSQREKWLAQLRVTAKAMLCSQQACVRRQGRRQKAYVLKKFSVSLHEEGRTAEALRLGLEALPLGFSLKWLGYQVYLGVLAAKEVVLF
jgi:glycosyltransferase involved in cell wall biosynthesis